MRTKIDSLRDRLSRALWWLAARIAAPDRMAHLPRCPDCEIGPDVGDDCPVCAAAYERQRYEDAIYAAGEQDAWEAMSKERDGWDG